MKKFTIILIALLFSFLYGNSQGGSHSSRSSLIQSISSNAVSSIGNTGLLTTDSLNLDTLQKNYLKQIPTFSISGLGTTQLTTNLSGNLDAQLNIRPTNDKAWNFLLDFNFGSSKDTTNLRSLSLSKIFFPDNSSFGFTGSIGFDILTLFGHQVHSIKHVNFGIGNEGKDIRYYSITPTIKYLYRKININDLKTTDSLSLVPRIETGTWYFELEFGSHWTIANNSFDITVAPYIKSQKVTQGTDSTYQYIFKDKNGGKQLSRFIVSEGVNISAQVGKIQLSFIYDYINPKVIKEPALTGGTFMLKVAVAADFLNFNFEPNPKAEELAANEKAKKKAAKEKAAKAKTDKKAKQ
jgi:hypothetical protein